MTRGVACAQLPDRNIPPGGAGSLRARGLAALDLYAACFVRLQNYASDNCLKRTIINGIITIISTCWKWGISSKVLIHPHKVSVVGWPARKKTMQKSAHLLRKLTGLLSQQLEIEAAAAAEEDQGWETDEGPLEGPLKDH